MTKEEIMKARVEKNLKVLKLLKDNDANINAEEKRAIFVKCNQLLTHLEQKM